MPHRLLAPLAILASPVAAQEVPSAPPPVSAPLQAPKLLVVISVDQLSGDLFAEYRRHFTGGFARLLEGAVFPAGYQGHAATETCPGHSTITSGVRPSRSGIVANDWIDLKAARADKTIYCAEDESVPGSSSSSYTVSDRHLLVPTLGEYLKRANPAARVVSVAGKDRAAVMMGGHQVDELWWWGGKAYVSYAGRPTPPVVAAVNAAVTMRIANAQAPMELPLHCVPRDHAVAIGGGKTVGTGRFARAAGDARAFRASPESDGATLALAMGLIDNMKLGRGAATDIITIGASATDFVGHTYGTGGSEMCLQLTSLDRDLGDFFEKLDAAGIDYAVALTADHGGHDLPERVRDNAVPGAQRLVPAPSLKAINDAIATKLKRTGQLLWGTGVGDVYVDPMLAPRQRASVIAEAKAALSAHPQVAAVFTGAEIAATPRPASPPDAWTPIERMRESYVAGRSGDLVVALKPRVTPIIDPTGDYVATHGSIWDYDRRVPILFWRKGLTGFEQPLAVETVDIAPTLAALAGVSVPAGSFDGRCLDLVAGPETSCR